MDNSDFHQRGGGQRFARILLEVLVIEHQGFFIGSGLKTAFSTGKKFIFAGNLIWSWRRCGFGSTGPDQGQCGKDNQRMLQLHNSALENEFNFIL